MNKFNYKIILLITLFLGLNINAYAQKKSNQLLCSELSVTSSGNIDIGSLARGDSKIVNGEIKFKISGSNNSNIIITNYADSGSDTDISVEYEWRMGPVTGKEYPFSTSVQQLFEGNYYVTVCVKRVTISNNAELGLHTLNQTVTVENIDP